MSGMDRLTDGQRRALVFAVAVVLAGMAMGFLSSFTTLNDAAQAHHWRFPWLLPASVDSGILAYVVLDLILGARSRWLHLAAWGLAAFTVWANAAVGADEGSVWRVIHAAMPALWVLGVEALRFTWKRLHEDSTQVPDVIPRGRWLASPLPALALWRRMHLAYHCGYERAAVLEDARLHAADLIRAAREAEPGVSVPASLRRAVRQGRLPGGVVAAVDAGMMFGGASRWEPEVASWVASALTLPERAAASLQTARRGITQATAERASQARPAAPEPTPQPVPQVPAKPSRAASARTPRKPSPSAVKRMSGSDLAPYVGTVLETAPGTTAADLMKSLRIGREKANDALRLARKERMQAVR